ncbi:uncharacterized protein B0H64DRAFT_368251 [Chaetomium fimeti]|uniref:Aminoglycoside phosphotransferase domain-containing protein n=1 Tax=Chaetomium fimeti TaxID=1854472 RepID=A0AAE0H6A8_9PEZI|nr:hypothetical protein B0H64DRAFT_368251 [Chaetomium fimeti]
MADDKDILPDQRILSEIFPDVPNITTDLCTVISNTFDTCTFRLQLPTEPRPGFPADLLIRLETSGSHLSAVAKLQHLAHLQIPHLVPATLAVGSATDATGREVDYSITPFLVGTTVLEEVWPGLDPHNQRSLVESIVVAMEQLQKAPLGSPDTGFHPEIKQILEAFLGERAAKSQACEILDTDDVIAVRSAIDGIGEIELTKPDLDQLMSSIVFCHNDLEPRNILVRQVGANGGGRYELAAIIDWEMAGFFPFAYESGLKDTVLGSSNLWFSWYSLFKEQTAMLIPKEEGHEKLIKALRIIAASKDARMPKNVGVRVAAKWIKRERLRMSPDVRHGWVREDGAGHVPVFTKEDNDSLELEVLRELGYIQ